jgi:hypothetical protein
MKVTFSSETRCNKAEKRGLPGDAQNYDAEIHIAAQKLLALTYTPVSANRRVWSGPSRSPRVSMKVTFSSETRCNKSRKTRFTRGRPELRRRDPYHGAKAASSHLNAVSANRRVWSGPSRSPRVSMKVTFSSETRCNKSRKTRFTRGRPELRRRDPYRGAKAKESAFVRRLGGQKRGLASKKAKSARSMSNSQQIAFHPNTKRRFSDVPTPLCASQSNMSGEIPCNPWGLNRSRQCSAIKKSDIYPVQNFYKRVEIPVHMGSYPRSSSILFALVHVLLGKPRFCPLIVV